MESSLRNITKIARTVRRYVTRKLKDTKFGADDYAFIAFIRHHSGCNQAALAEEMNIDKGSVSRKIKKLEKEGYVTKTQNQNDKRNWCIYPTKAAENVKQLSVEAENQFYAYLIKESNISETELEQFLSVLDKLHVTEKAERKNAFQDLL